MDSELVSFPKFTVATKQSSQDTAMIMPEEHDKEV